jgi:paraquat-inducible protein B
MSNYSNQNRLLALEKELYKWKQAPQNLQSNDEPIYQVTSQEVEEELENIDDDFEQQLAEEPLAPLNGNNILEFVNQGNFSYSGMASVLSSNASQRFKNYIEKLQTQEDDLAPTYLNIEQPIKQPTTKSTKPTLELSEIILPEADSTEFSFVNDTNFSESQPSYSSLLQALQEARLNNVVSSEEETENQA